MIPFLMLCMAGNKVQGLKHFKPLERRISPWKNLMILLSVKLDFPGIKLPLILDSCLFQFVKLFTHSSRFHSGVPQMGVSLPTPSQSRWSCFAKLSDPGAERHGDHWLQLSLWLHWLLYQESKGRNVTAHLIHSLILGFKILSRTFLLPWFHLGAIDL